MLITRSEGGCGVCRGPLLAAPFLRLGLGTRAWDTTLVMSQFDYAADMSFADAATTTYLVALARDGSAAGDLVKARFAARGIVVTE